jgi:hypothetical protein
MAPPARFASRRTEGGSPLSGFGVPPKTSFPSCAAAGCMQKARKKVFGDNPSPGRETLHPRFWELFQKFGMTHN